jgi:hypothetical protein
MGYYSETEKVIELIDPKYLQGKVIDIGCGDHKVTPEAIGVDGRDRPGVNIVIDGRDIHRLSYEYQVQLGNADTVFSSHCLEHLINDTFALTDWAFLIKANGYLILYLPDSRKYSNDGNLEHMREYTYETFMFYFRRVFCGEGKNFKGENFDPVFKIIESGVDFREDCYSFFVIAQKL